MRRKEHDCYNCEYFKGCRLRGKRERCKKENAKEISRKIDGKRLRIVINEAGYDNIGSEV